MLALCSLRDLDTPQRKIDPKLLCTNHLTRFESTHDLDKLTRWTTGQKVATVYNVGLMQSAYLFSFRAGKASPENQKFNSPDYLHCEADL